MKLILTITLIAMSSLNLFAQSKHIEQSTPFENVLLSMKSNSSSQFIKSFSERIIDGEYDEKIWMSRLKEGKETFEKRFGFFQSVDFAYEYDKIESSIIIYYKTEEQMRMRVIEEGGVWKLDEK